MHGASGIAHLTDRHPSVTPERLIAQLVPPPTFADVSFDTYRPDPAEPSQTAAVQACRQFCEQAVQRRAGKKKLFGRREVLPGVGLYLDGGFGVGKTHLLASTYYALAAADAGPSITSRRSPHSANSPSWQGFSASSSASSCLPTTWWCASTSSNSTTRATRR